MLAAFSVRVVPSRSAAPHARGAARLLHRTALALLVIGASACASASGTTAGTMPAPVGTTPDAATPAALAGARVLDARRATTVSAAAMFDALARADAVFVGEQHDDAATHRLELAVLEELARRGRPVVLALEMFERDVQPLLDDYLAGRADEGALLAGARPWPNYATDYRPLVEFARAHGWPVVASNVPRPLASLVARGGLAVLDTLAASQRAHAAAALHCPDDAYRRKFAATMGDMSAHGPAGAPAGADSAARAVAAATMLQRIYEAQCVKDETMGESVAAALRPGTTVVHVNGSFHSDERLGTVARLLRRRPSASVLVVATTHGEPPLSFGDYVVVLP